MKLPFILPFAWLATLFGMDRPPHLPKEPSSYQEMPGLRSSREVDPAVIEDSPHHHKRLSTHIEGKVGDTVIDITKNETLSKSTDTEDSNKNGHSTKFVAITNMVTGLITAAIGAGVTIAVRYGGDCKKD